MDCHACIANAENLEIFTNTNYAFPGITETDRLRVNMDTTFRNDIVRDCFWVLSLYSGYDNQPAEGAESEDDGIETSIGTSFQAA